MNLRTIILCFVSMISFAANSILCRIVLKETAQSPLEFTAIRLISGSLFLLPIILWNRREINFNPINSLIKGIPLFTYALFFSLAYTQMESGIGALILFSSVQITMIGISILNGTQISKIEWVGFLVAFAGLVFLLLPGLSSPPLKSGVLMLLSGISWGIYSLLGKGVKDPISSTAKNFLVAAILSSFLFIFITKEVTLFDRGFYLACVSGSITSGLGYVLWYMALKNTSTTVASIIQLTVPILAAFGGVLFISETLSLRLMVSTTLILIGMLLTIKGQKASI